MNKINHILRNQVFTSNNFKKLSLLVLSAAVITGGFFASEAEAVMPSSDATLSVFTIGGENVLGLPGITEPDGAELEVPVSTILEGVIVTTNNPNASLTPLLNGGIVIPPLYPILEVVINDIVEVVVTAEDGTIQTYKVTVVTDKTAPIIELNSPEEGLWTSADALDFKFTVTDNLDDEVQCMFDFDVASFHGVFHNDLGLISSGIEYTHNYNLDYEEADQMWRVRCYDNAGNMGESEWRSLNVDRTVVEEPKWFKADAIEGLKLIETSDKKTQKDIEKAIRHIKKSLNIDPKNPSEPWKKQDLWIDNSHLNPKHGKKVFDEEKKAVKGLMRLMDKKDTPEVLKEAYQTAIDKLIKADDILAKTVYDEALELTGDPKVDKELEKCAKELEKADEELTKEHYDKAIDHYKRAWDHAQKAIKHANK